MLNKIKNFFKKQDAESAWLEAGNISSEFTCKCGKQKGWITEGRVTQPCPECGKRYIGYYDHKSLTIVAREVVPADE